MNAKVLIHSSLAVGPARESARSEGMQRGLILHPAARRGATATKPLDLRGVLRQHNTQTPRFINSQQFKCRFVTRIVQDLRGAVLNPPLGAFSI